MDNYIDYYEYNDLGRYLAYMRHEIMVHNWINLTRNGQSFFNTVESNSYRIELKECLSVTRSNVINLAYVSRLDMNVSKFVMGMDISRFLSFIKQEMFDYEDLFKNDFWENWTKYIEELVQEIQGLPEPLIQTHLRKDLYYVYMEQYEQIIKRIGVNELAEIINWDKKKISAYKKKNFLPEPVQILSSTPLWTVGQAEKFKLVLNNREENKKTSRGDWKTLLSKPTTKLELELWEDNESPEEKIYEFNNRGSSYFYSDAYHIFDEANTSLDDAVAMSNYLFKKVDCAPEIHANIGRRYLKAEMYDKALEHLEAAKSIYENVIPEDFEGRLFDGNDDHYHFTLADLSYLYYLKSDIEKSRDMLISLSNIRPEYIDTQELLDNLNNSTDTFGSWYKDNYLSHFNQINDI